MVHRTDLLNELRRLVTSEEGDGEGQGKACELYLGSRVVECHPEEGVVVLEGGERVEGDIVIGADGINVRSFPSSPHYHVLLSESLPSGNSYSEKK